MWFQDVYGSVTRQIAVKASQEDVIISPELIRKSEAIHFTSREERISKLNLQVGSTLSGYILSSYYRPHCQKSLRTKAQDDLLFQSTYDLQNSTGGPRNTAGQTDLIMERLLFPLTGISPVTLSRRD